jgi:hypothetical protein
MKHILLLMIAFATMHVTTHAEGPWPKDISIPDGGKLTMYEPQPESLSGDQLKGRAAVALRKSSGGEPVFGAILFTATIGNNNSPEFASLRITNAKFPGIEDEDEVDQYTALLEKNAPGWSLGMSKDELQAAIDHENGTGDDAFNNAAPKIIYADKPTTLIVLDGKPITVHDKNLDADKIANSPNVLFKEGNRWNLYAGGKWYQSGAVTDGWKVNDNLSKKVQSVNESIKKEEEKNNNGNTPAVDPKVTDIIVATEPTELLQTDGEPVYKNVSGTNLLYVSNSPNEIFKDINSQKTYIVIAGRWYNAPDINGPWTYVPSDKLPEDFAQIPGGSDKSAVLANVAGTEEAEDARLDAAIPQTAKVDRKTATIDVQYDGAPVFHQIDGTSLELAENSNVTVMMDASGNYFALNNGVWFISDDAYGPWKVANDRPRDIDNIPPSSPAYNTRYVYVYDYTPDYVYMGYTGGYLGSYFYGPTIVYGTGFHYRPWFHTVYYPRPITWGFGFGYDPWYGWNINFGYNYGFLYVGYDYGYGYGWGGGWFGPRRYCPPYRRPYWHGGYYAGRHSYYGRTYYNTRNDYGYRNANGNRYYGSRPADRGLTGSAQNSRPRRTTGWSNNSNIYNNQRGVVAQNSPRSPRLYRPVTSERSGGSVNSSINNRVGGRVPSNTNPRPSINNRNEENSRVPDNSNGGRLSRENPRRPVIHEPSNSSRPSTSERPSRVERPSASERPVPAQRPVREAPVRNSERRVPGVQRPEPVQRSAPVQRAERPAPVQRAQRPAPVQRSSPAPRPSVSRPSAPQRSSSSSGGGGAIHRGERPGRR